MIKISERTEGMMNASADYYQTADEFRAVQNAQALEYDRIEANNDDLAPQLLPTTATWGLSLHEGAVGITPRAGADLETRRAAVLAKNHMPENFSAPLVKRLVSMYDVECDVYIDYADDTIYVDFPDGFPDNFDDIVDMLQDYIHAHLDIAYRTEQELTADLIAAVICVKDIAWQTIAAGNVEPLIEQDIPFDMGYNASIAVDEAQETVIYNNTMAVVGIAISDQAVAGKEV